MRVSLTLWVCSGKAQIAESKHRLRRLLDEADDAVTMVRVGGDDVENSRRSGAENMRLDRRRRLLAEAELSAKVKRTRPDVCPCLLHIKAVVCWLRYI